MNTSIFVKIIAALAALKDILALIRVVVQAWQDANKAPNPPAAKAVVKSIIWQDLKSPKSMAERLKKVKYNFRKIKKSGRKL